MLVVGPHTEVAAHGRVHVLERIRTAGLDRFAHFFSHYYLQKSGKRFPSYTDGDAARAEKNRFGCGNSYEASA
jgi:hypothetical protein